MSEKQRQACQKYRNSEKGKAVRSAYARSIVGKESQAKYARSAKGQATRCRFHKMPLPTRAAPDFCECCNGPKKGNGQFHIDHDHETGEFRGWLCSSCNTGIGLLGDTLQGLQLAIKYLSKDSRSYD